MNGVDVYYLQKYYNEEDFILVLIFIVFFLGVFQKFCLFNIEKNFFNFDWDVKNWFLGILYME